MSADSTRAWDRRAWLAAVAARDDDGRLVVAGVSTRLVAAVLAQFADHTTGAEARPSVATLVELTGLKRRAVTRALHDLEGAGLIVHAGYRRRTVHGGGSPVKVWTLRLPSRPSEGPLDDHPSRPSEGPLDDHPSRPSEGPLDDYPSRPSQAAQPSLSGTPSRPSQGPQPPSSSRPEGGRDEEEGALRPSAGATGLRAPNHAAAGAAVAAIATTVIGRGRAWGEYDARRIDAAQLAAVVSPWLDAGWTPDDLAAAAATSARPRSNAARMLQEHLARTLGDTDPATWRRTQAAVAVEPAAANGRGRRGATKKAKAAASLEAAPPPPPPPVWLHHLAQEVQDALGRPLAWYYAETGKPDGRTGHYVLRHDGADVLVLQGDVGGRDWTATRTDTDQAVEVTAGPPAEATRRILELWRTPTTELTNGANA